LAVLGTAALAAALLALLWTESYDAERERAGNLANTLGERTEAILIDTRDLLGGLDLVATPPCSPEHLQAMQEAAATRPHLRALGYWRASERVCGVGFVASDGLRPPRADRIYDSGVIAWWPGPHTEVGGVPLFLMRFGQHDAAIDPRLLIDDGTLDDRRAALWVEGLRMVTAPSNAELPEPQTLPQGLQVDTVGQRLLSRFSHNAVFPIDVVAVEPLASFWSRQRTLLAVGSSLALLLLGAWLLMLQRVTRRRLSPEAELRRALQEGRIVAHYQPVIEFSSGRCIGAEALARWEHEDGRLLAPDRFLPLAEQCGLTPAITAAILEAILQDLPELLEVAPQTTINLNLAPQDLEDNAFERLLIAGLQRSGLPPAAIKLEITERGLVNSDSARALIRGFRGNGHQVAVDDFGTGYSSLSYLQSFELDILKIDKTFVDAIGTEAATSQVIVHVIEMAHALGLELVAEGVEWPAQAEWLVEHGVRFGQGYLYSAALPARDFHQFLQSSVEQSPEPRPGAR
jgi:sensor c-di-GMP phosphodiesterase-like protein